MQEPDTKPGLYYVSWVDGSTWGVLLGPFVDDHQKALDLVDAVHDRANELDRRSWFKGFGTLRLDSDIPNPPVGKLNLKLEGKAAFHEKDEDCSVWKGTCILCGVSHDTACLECTGRGFHRYGCTGL